MAEAQKTEGLGGLSIEVPTNEKKGAGNKMQVPFNRTVVEGERAGDPETIAKAKRLYATFTKQTATPIDQLEFGPTEMWRVCTLLINYGHKSLLGK